MYFSSIVFHMCFLYINFSDRFLPDKAIDLIDEAGSHAQLCHAKVTWQLICDCNLKSLDQSNEDENLGKGFKTVGQSTLQLECCSALDS